MLWPQLLSHNFLICFSSCEVIFALTAFTNINVFTDMFNIISKALARVETLCLQYKFNCNKKTHHCYQSTPVCIQGRLSSSLQFLNECCCLFTMLLMVPMVAHIHTYPQVYLKTSHLILRKGRIQGEVMERMHP